jgi:hypothetical protein
MKRTKTVFTIVLLFAFGFAPQFNLVRQAKAQDRINFRALGIDNEARQIGSLFEAQAKFFARGSELKGKAILSPRDPASFREDADEGTIGMRLSMPSLRRR